MLTCCGIHSKLWLIFGGQINTFGGKQKEKLRMGVFKRQSSAQSFASNNDLLDAKLLTSWFKVQGSLDIKADQQVSGLIQ